MTITLADIDRWDPDMITAVFEAAIARAHGTRAASAAIGETVGFLDWDGETAEAARAAAGHTMVNLDEHADTCEAVARAAETAAGEVAAIKARLAQIRVIAHDYHLSIDNDTGSVSLPENLSSFSASDQREITEAPPRVAAAITALLNDADATDADLATALRGVDGELSPDDVNAEVASHAPVNGGDEDLPRPDHEIDETIDETEESPEASESGGDAAGGGDDESPAEGPLDGPSDAPLDGPGDVPADGPPGDVIDTNGNPESDLPFPFGPTEDLPSPFDPPGEVIDSNGNPESDLPFPLGPVGPEPNPFEPPVDGDGPYVFPVPLDSTGGVSPAIAGNLLGSGGKAYNYYGDAVTDHGRHWTEAAKESNKQYVAGLKRTGGILGRGSMLVTGGLGLYDVLVEHKSPAEVGTKVAANLGGAELGALALGAAGFAVGGPVGTA